MSAKTIAEIVAATGVSRYTIHSAAANGLLKAASRQSGRTWLIDDEHPDYKEWLHRPEQTQKGRGKPRGQRLGQCCQCGQPATVECSIGKCAPRSCYCAHCYEQVHLPEDERGREGEDANES